MIYTGQLANKETTVIAICISTLNCLGNLTLHVSAIYIVLVIQTVMYKFLMITVRTSVF